MTKALKHQTLQLPDFPDLSHETRLWEKGIRNVAGLDEVGRGALAGPVVVAAVVLPPNPQVAKELCGVRDSKQMTPRSRELWAQRIQALASFWSVGWASNEEVDQFGIVNSVQTAALRALESLPEQPEFLLLDYMRKLDYPVQQTTLVKGDRRSLSIASASILAKVYRDGVLCHYDLIYPGYELKNNKGYGTRMHRLALTELGPTPIHRRSFKYKVVEPD